MSIGAGLFPANTLIPLQRLHSLAFGFGTFACAKDQASSPHDGLLKENPGTDALIVCEAFISMLPAVFLPLRLTPYDLRVCKRVSLLRCQNEKNCPSLRVRVV